MGRRLALLLIVLLCPAPAWAGLRFTPTTADLGEIRGGPPRQRQFAFVNDGAEPIEIVEVQPGCGCLATELDRRVVPPGVQGTLRVQLRTTGQPNGPRAWNLRVRFREGGTLREQVLVLNARIQNEVSVQPAVLALDVASVLRQEVVVADARSPGLKVTDARATSPAVKVTTEPAANGVTKVVLEVAADDLRPGRHDELLNIYTDDPLYSPLQVPLTLRRGSRPVVVATPAQVRLRVAAGRPVGSALVRLRPTGEHKVAVAAVASDDPALTCTWAAGPENNATLKVQVDGRKLTPRDGPREVRVQLVGTRETLTIPVVIDRE